MTYVRHAGTARGIMNADYTALEADLELLTDLLDRAVLEFSGEAALAMVRDLRRAAIAVRGGAGVTRAQLSARIAALDLEQLATVARAFTLWFHLANAAEEQHRIRRLRTYDREHPARDSIDHGVAQLRAAGLDDAEVAQRLARLFVMPVLTAHPTEARRRTLRDHAGEIRLLLDALECPKGERARGELLEALQYRVAALYGTEEFRATKPEPRDEIEAGLDVFRRTLLDATPAVYRELEGALARRFPERDWLGLGASEPSRWGIGPMLSWGSWIGGDRDGNPFVTAHVTRTTLERQRAVAFERHLADVDALGRTLSLSAQRVPRPAGLAELHESLARDRERFPELAARVQRFTAHEPWREKLWYIAARLRATRDRGDQAYVDAAGYQRDLLLLERSLVACGQARLARGALRDCRRRAAVFGFHLASLDLRQHSSVHERVVAELLAALAVPLPAPYPELAEAERCRVLHDLLAHPEPLVPKARAALSAEAQDLLATLDMVARARREQGPRACERYVVSFTSALSDLLEVLLLERAADLRPGELKPVPLLEQLEDLERAGELAEGIAASPPLRAALAGELEVMIGYSDSCKQVGYVASLVALHRAQHALAGVAERTGLTLTIFHGRGGAIGRGGGPAHETIRAQPERAMRGRLRVTEQGETISARYGSCDVAQRDLEQVISAVLLSGLAERNPVPPADLAARERLLDHAARAALGAYRELLADRDRITRYTLAATPMRVLAALPIGSRPTARKPGLAFEDLRAIPWVFSWTQCRHGIPGWYGLGTALEAAIAEFGLSRVRELYRASSFFHALIENAQLALVRADMDIAALYAELADDDARRLFAPIRAEWDRTLAGVLAVIERSAILEGRPHILAAVRRRNPHVDVLSHAQVELLRRLAAAGDEDERRRITAVLFTTINGIAAGLQSAG